MTKKFKSGDLISRIEMPLDKKIVTAVQDVACSEYQLDGNSYWWAASAVDSLFELDVLVESPLWKALS